MNTNFYKRDKIHAALEDLSKREKQLNEAFMRHLRAIQGNTNYPYNTITAELFDCCHALHTITRDLQGAFFDYERTVRQAFADIVPEETNHV